MQTVKHGSLRVADLFGVAGKTVLVTGGGRGIGEMIARAFIENNANVYITSRRGEALKRKAEELSKLGPGICRAIPGDVSTEKGVQEIRAQFADAEEKLHVLVNNSGISWGAPFEKFPESEWDRVLAVNVKAPFLMTRAMRPFLDAAATYSDSSVAPEEGVFVPPVLDPSRVINIGSVVGVHPQPVPTYSYDVSKAAVHSLTTKLSSELAPSITVNAIAPGYVPSRMSRGLLAFATEKQMIDSVPMKRLGSATDMGGTALFLSSQAAAWITGQVIVVDGGTVAKPLQLAAEDTDI